MIPRNTSVTICQHFVRKLKSFPVWYRNNTIFLYLSKSIHLSTVLQLLIYNVIMEKITQKFNLDYSSTIANIRKRKKKSIKCFMHIPTKEFDTHEDFVDQWIGNIVCFDTLDLQFFKKIFSIALRKQKQISPVEKQLVWEVPIAEPFGYRCFWPNLCCGQYPKWTDKLCRNFRSTFV